MSPTSPTLPRSPAVTLPQDPAWVAPDAVGAPHAVPWSPQDPLPSAGPAPRTIRWGCGDIGFGLLLMFVLSVVFVIPVAAVLLAGAPAGEAVEEAVDVNSPGIVIAGLAATWAGLGGWALIASKWRGLGSLREDFHYWIKLPHDIGLGLAGGVVAILAGAVVAMIESALQVDAISNGQFLETTRESDMVMFAVLGLGAAIGAPVVEELFFRGLAFTALQRRLDTAWALVISTVLFGIMHFQSADSAASTAFLVAHITTFGLVLGGLRAWTGRCGASIVAHMVINGFGVALVLFRVG